MFARTTLACTILIFATAVFAQQPQQQPQRTVGDRVEVTPPATPEQSTPHKYEINVFTGFTGFHELHDSFNTQLATGGLLGTGFTWNHWNKVALEGNMVYYAVNNLRLTTGPGTQLGLGARMFQWNVDPVFHFSGRTSRVRPYVSAGWGQNRFYPTRDAIRQAGSVAAADPSLGVLASLDADTVGTFNYGAGIKWRLTKGGGVGLRFDARGLISKRPTFEISTSRANLYGFQPTVGINFWLGKKPRDREYERTITITEPPRTVTNNSISLGALQGGGEVCGGTPINLSITANTNPANVPVQYQWAVNGMNTGGNQNTLTFNAPDAGGDQRVTVTITDTSQGATRAQPVTVTQTIRVRPYVRPTIQITSGATEVQATDTSIPFVATTQGDCGGALTTTWTASEGRITPNAQNPNQATFDATSVTFGAGGATDQVKQITVTGTVRDTRNQTSAGTAQVSVRKRAVAVQLADILFVRGSTRVNNCGQRILTDDVYPQFRNGYSIVLVGHTDPGDPRTANLDRDRAYNVGRLLRTGGRSPRNTIDSQNIRVDWVGTDQTSPKNSKQCETSVREAAGNAISANDAAAPNRRVEIWLVPNGAAMPAAVKNPRDLPAR